MIALPQASAERFEPDYGVEKVGGSIRLELGFAPAFEVPRATAIKLALLILRKCGVSVNISGAH